jgi:protein-S-isoprenylcysteine O-methyltransferase Ste14
MPAVLQLALFIILSASILTISRASLRVPGSHGFYRFFAWEAILGLVLINLPAWFRDPFSVHQVISWLLLVASLFLVVEGVRLLGSRGRPDQHQVSPVPRLGIEKTTRLVTSGLYGYIRHPLYSSLLFLDWGTFLKKPGWFGGFLALVASLCLLATARVEEAENLREFGPDYAAYVRRTRRFIPFLF